MAGRGRQQDQSDRGQKRSGGGRGSVPYSSKQAYRPAPTLEVCLLWFQSRELFYNLCTFFVDNFSSGTWRRQSISHAAISTSTNAGMFDHKVF